MCVCLVINILVMIVITWFIQASWLPCTNIKITSKHFTLITKSKERIYDFMGHIIQYDLQNHVSRDVFVIFYFTYFLYCAGCSLPHQVWKNFFIYLLLKVHLYKKMAAVEILGFFKTLKKNSSFTRKNTPRSNLTPTKVVWVFSMVVVSILHHAEFGRTNYWEDASHFNIQIYSCWLPFHGMSSSFPKPVILAESYFYDEWTCRGRLILTSTV